MSRFARGKMKHRAYGVMNKLEELYAAKLEQLRHEGYILWFAYESVKLKLADNTYYTPDFAVMKSDGELEMHEVKGFWQDAARIKIKVAADRFPIRFRAFKQKTKSQGGGWDEELFGSDE